MKRYVCPQCGTSAPVRLYHKPGRKLMCFACTTPGNPVYIDVIDEEQTKPRKVKSA